MSSTASRIVSLFSSLPIFFLAVSYIPTSCLAQQSLYTRQDASVTTRARNPDPSWTPTWQPSTVRSAPAQTHTVQVGFADHKFRPEVTEAEVGDTIEFRFYPTNHSVVRAEYGFPCIPYEMTGSGKDGFFSGFHDMDKVLDDPPKFSILINDTNPIFFYCSAPGSCTTYGMVGAINPTFSATIDTQKELALKSAYQLSPGEPFPDEAPRPSSKPISPSAPGASSPEETPDETPAGTPKESTKERGLSTGAIVGIVVASVSVVILGALLFFFLGRTKTLKDEVLRRDNLERQASPSSTTPMLEAGQRTGRGGEGFRSCQEQTQNCIPARAPAPAPTSAPAQTQAQAPVLTFTSPQQQRQQPNYTSSSPRNGYTAYTPSAYSPLASDGAAPDMTRTTSSRTIAVGLQPSPTGSYPRSPTSPNGNDPYALSSPYPQDQYTSPQQLLLPTPISPQRRAAPEAKLGPYGRQIAHEPAPSYAETVSRPAPLHVNERIGPAEMEGSGVVKQGDWWRWGDVRPQLNGNKF